MDSKLFGFECNLPSKKKKKRMDGIVFLFSVGSSSPHLCDKDDMCVF